MEVKKDAKIEEAKSNLTLENRKKLQIDGVIEVVSFNDQEIVLKTKLGGLNIRGENLKMNKLDVHNGNLNITGKINSCTYSDISKDKEKEGIFARLFK